MSLGHQDFRRHKRVTFTTRAALRLVSASGDPIEKATTIDLSEVGARVRLSGQIQPGQIVELFLSNRPEQYRVVWTNPAGPKEQLVAGLEVSSPLPGPQHRPTPHSSGFEPIN
jgi:hypothetical protein